MNYPQPNYLLPFVVGGTLATVAAILLGVNKALKLGAWPPPERKRAFWMTTALLVIWLVASLSFSSRGVFQAGPSGAPTIQFGLLIPIIAGVALFWGSKTLRGVVNAVPQQWMVSVQLYRVEGLIFLVLYAAGRLPGVFAWPAGVGDILVGLLAPVAGAAYARRAPNAESWLLAWNLLGITDLIVAVTTGFLSSPSRFQMFAIDAPNHLVTAFPLVMIPVFLVPLSILLHFASLYKMRKEQTRSQLHNPLFAGQGD